MKIYTKKTLRLRRIYSAILLILFFPMWSPLWLLSVIGYFADNLMWKLDHIGGNIIHVIVSRKKDLKKAIYTPTIHKV